ncbi:MAG: hypothetical protein ACKO47_00585, partial [Alphaproteobacteria bacterium]
LEQDAERRPAKIDQETRADKFQQSTIEVITPRNESHHQQSIFKTRLPAPAYNSPRFGSDSQQGTDFSADVDLITKPKTAGQFSTFGAPSQLSQRFIGSAGSLDFVNQAGLNYQEFDVISPRTQQQPQLPPPEQPNVPTDLASEAVGGMGFTLNADVVVASAQPETGFLQVPKQDHGVGGDGEVMARQVSASPSPQIITGDEADDRLAKMLASIKEYESENRKKIFVETSDEKGRFGIAIFNFSFEKPRAYNFKFKNNDSRSKFIEILKKYDPSSQADTSSDLKKITNFLLSDYPDNFKSINSSPIDSDIDVLKKLLRNSEDFKKDFDSLREIKDQNNINMLAERLYEIVQEKQSQAQQPQADQAKAQQPQAQQPQTDQPQAQQPSTTPAIRRQRSAGNLGSNLGVDPRVLEKSLSRVASMRSGAGDPLSGGSADALKPLGKRTGSGRD